MRILFANPNTTVAVTDRIAAVARAAASPGTEIVAVTGQQGVPYMATRAEAVIGARVVLELLAEHAPGCDAAVVAAFADPGVGGARELHSIPVIGMAEAAMLTACMLGRRFSIVTFATAMEPWYRECVDYNGLTGRLASIRCVSGGFRDIAAVQHEKEAALVEACQMAVEQDEADVVILGCAARGSGRPGGGTGAGAVGGWRRGRCPTGRGSGRITAKEGNRGNVPNARREGHYRGSGCVGDVVFTSVALSAIERGDRQHYQPGW